MEKRAFGPPAVLATERTMKASSEESETDCVSGTASEMRDDVMDVDPPEARMVEMGTPVVSKADARVAAVGVAGTGSIEKRPKDGCLDVSALRKAKPPSQCFCL